MSWQSFTAITDLLVAALQSNADLASFCATELDSALTVKKAFKRREEVRQDELPVILLTIPAQTSEYRAGRLIYRTHIVRLYCGFQQDDNTKAQDELIKLEEFIEQALLNDAALNAENVEMQIGDSANDEGFFHPIYFISKEFRIVIEHAI